MRNRRRRLRIGLAKPEFGYVGGFERVLARIAAQLAADGHDVRWLDLEASGLRRQSYGVPVPAGAWRAAPEAFRYLALHERFRRLAAPNIDLLLSTQPPSFAVEHPRHLALFYHHERQFYDLAALVEEARLVDPLVHRAAAQAVRTADAASVAGIRHFLVPSREVAQRLREFGTVADLTATSPYRAGVGFRAQPNGSRGHSSYALCVSRHRFPKRAELFVHALKYLPALTGALVGEGGRLGWARTLDAQLSQPEFDLEAVGPRDLWLNPGRAAASVYRPGSNVVFLPELKDADLAGAFASALCVVAPAYREDYGLTAVEAMTWGKPLVVCRDGGGLVEFVEDGVTGFVVEPTGRAIADAVRRLAEDPALADEMGREARERASAFTWERARRELYEGIDRAFG